MICTRPLTEVEAGQRHHFGARCQRSNMALTGQTLEAALQLTSGTPLLPARKAGPYPPWGASRRGPGKSRGRQMPRPFSWFTVGWRQPR